jgi:hypothetical protein
MPMPHDLELALLVSRDRRIFLQNLLIDGLQCRFPTMLKAGAEGVVGIELSSCNHGSVSDMVPVTKLRTSNHDTRQR